MRSTSSFIPVSILGIVSVVLLGGCSLPGHYLEELESIPVPKTALLARASRPNCLMHAKKDVIKKGLENKKQTKPAKQSSDKEKQVKTIATSKPDEKVTDANTTNLKKKTDSDKQTPNKAIKSVSNTSKPRPKLNGQIDCYRRAERRVRARLNRLQVSTRRTIAALASAKRRLKSSSPVQSFEQRSYTQGKSR